MPLRKDIFDPSGQVDPNSELAKQAAQDEAYGQYYEKALGTIKPPAQGAKYMQGPEGQLWQGIAQQQQFGAAQAGRRGFNPFAARGAAQSGAELESQGYGAAQDIRQQQDAFARQAALGLAQQRSEFGMQQAGLDTAQMQQQLQQKLWEQAQQNQLAQEQRARQQQAFEGGLNAFQSTLGMLPSDERLKTAIEPGGAVADSMMDALPGGSPDDVQMIGEFGSKTNPRTAIVYTGNRPAKAVAAPPVAAGEPMPYLTDENFDEEYGAVDDGQRKLMQPLAMPIKGVAITDLGEGGPANVMSQGEVIPSSELGLDVRGMTPERRAKAEAALGISRPIDPRAQAYVAQAMPKTAAFLANPPISDYEYGVATVQPAERTAADIAGRTVLLPTGTYQVPTQTLLPETPEQAYRRRIADRNAKMIGDALNKQSDIFERRANRSAQEKGDELATMMNQHKEDFNKSLGGNIADQALDNTVPYGFNYKDSVGIPGRRLGVMAQDLAKSPVTRNVVKQTPVGLAIDPTEAVGTLFGLAGRLHQRLGKLEGK